MKSDMLIRLEGMQALNKSLGLVEAERFIALLKRENFDYTTWQREHFANQSVDDIISKISKQ